MPFLKLFHLFFVFLWVGGLFTTTTLLSYGKRPGLKNLARSLLLKHDLPFMILTVVTGFTLFFLNGVSWKAGWLHTKFLSVAFFITIDFLALWSCKKPFWHLDVWLKYFLWGALLLVLFAIYILKTGVLHG